MRNCGPSKNPHLEIAALDEKRHFAWKAALPGEILRGRCPRENVEIVRRIYGEWGRGNFHEGTELYDPHVLLVLRPGVRPGYWGGGVLRR